MNHLRNLVAKNLHQVEMILPRPASRFEPMNQNNWLGVNHIPMLDREDMRDEIGSSTEPAFSARDDPSARTLSAPVFSSTKQEPSGHVVSTDPVTSASVQNRRRDHRSLQMATEAKSSIPFSEQRAVDTPENAQVDNAKASRHMHSSIGTSTTVSSGTPASSMQFRSRQKLAGPGITQDVEAEDRSEKQISAEFDYVKKAEDAGYGMIPESGIEEKYSEGLKSAQKPSEDEIVPLKLVEEHVHLSPHQEKRIPPEITLKQREIENSNQDKEKKSDSKNSISARMIVVQPIVKRFFKPEKNDFEDRKTNLETKADVLVTIGRIEVRAMPLATISQRKQEKPPVISLEDYLKNKRGGL